MVITTALFDLGRASWLNYWRDISKYKNYSKNMLSLRCKMVIYTTEDLKMHFEDERRKHDPKLENTIINVLKLEDIPYYDYLDRIDNILKSEYFISKVRNSGNLDPSRPEANYALYNIINFAKSKFVKMTIENSYFDDNLHCWMDVGIYHEKFPEKFLNKKYPFKNEQILLDGKIHQFYKTHPKDSDINKVLYYGSYDSVRIVGAWFGGTKEAMLVHAQRVNKVVDDSISEGVISYDQDINTIAYLEDKSLYNLHDGNFANNPWFAGLDYFL